MKTVITNLVVRATALKVGGGSRPSGRMTTVVTSAVQGPRGRTGPPGAGLHLETFTLNTEQIEARAIELPFAPDRPDKAVVHVLGGIRQFHAVDFVIDGSTLSWAGLALEHLLCADSLIQVEILI